MDIVAIVIIFLSAVLGMKKGFAYTVISFLQWFASLFLGFFFCNKLKAFIYDNTQIDEYIKEIITNHLGSSVETNTAYNSVPDLFSGVIESSAKVAISTTAEQITSMILTVSSFILIILCIRLICFLFLRLFSKRHNDGVIGFIDGFGGFLIGLFRGGLLLLIVFAVMIPILGVLWPEASTYILNSLDSSRFAGEIYNNNILLRIITDFFS